MGPSFGFDYKKKRPKTAEGPENSPLKQVSLKKDKKGELKKKGIKSMNESERRLMNRIGPNSLSIRGNSPHNRLL